MADYLVTDTELMSIADAIRTKGGTSAALTFPAGFVSAVNSIPTGGGGGLQIYSSDIADNALELPTGVSMSDFFNGTVKAAYFTNIVIEYDGGTYTLSYVPICWNQLDPLSFDGYGSAVSDGVGFVVYYSIYDGSGSVDGAWSADYGAEMPVDSIEADQSLGSLFCVIK